MHVPLRGEQGDDGYQLQPDKPKTLSLVRKAVDTIMRLSSGNRPDLRSADVRGPRAAPWLSDRLLPEPLNGASAAMKDIYQVIRQKELEMSIIRGQIEALKFCIPLLADDPDPDEHILAETAQTRS